MPAARPTTLWRTRLSGRQTLDLARQAFTAFLDDHAPSMGAALAHYTLFSLAPLLERGCGGGAATA